MHAILSLLSLRFGGFGILTMVALIDAVRVGADWYWFLIILAFPGIGPIAYFVVVRSPLLGARNAGMMSPAAARRLQARRRLRELQVQLANWRGPGILAEAGEETLALGKPQEAEKLLREAKANGGVCPQAGADRVQPGALRAGVCAAHGSGLRRAGARAVGEAVTAAGARAGL